MAKHAQTIRRLKLAGIGPQSFKFPWNSALLSLVETYQTPNKPTNKQATCLFQYEPSNLAIVTICPYNKYISYWGISDPKRYAILKSQ